MAIDRVDLQPAAPFPPPGRPQRSAPAGTSFADVLSRATEQVHLTRHAQKRIERRELNLDPQRLARLNSAITRAAEKGGRNSVVMLDDLAVVVNVRERTVITAMPKEGNHQRVFTNVDSVVIA